MNNRLVSSVYATLVLSACILQGFTLPQLKSYSADEYSRKFGSVSDISNSIEELDSSELSPAAKQDDGLVGTVVELALKFVPLLIGVISGETGPSQTDRIEGIDLNVSRKQSKCLKFKFINDFSTTSKSIIISLGWRCY